MKEATGDWIHDSAPPLWCHAEVWMANGSVRRVETDVTPMGLGLFFTDCAHPQQNVICDRQNVKAWRFCAASIREGV